MLCHQIVSIGLTIQYFQEYDHAKIYIHDFHFGLSKFTNNFTQSCTCVLVNDNTYRLSVVFSEKNANISAKMLTKYRKWLTTKLE